MNKQYGAAIYHAPPVDVPEFSNIHRAPNKKKNIHTEGVLILKIYRVSLQFICQSCRYIGKTNIG